MSSDPERPPSIPDTAKAVAGAMLAGDPVQPIGFATAGDGKGKNLYLVAVIMGDENAKKARQVLFELGQELGPVDIDFGEDEDGAEDGKSVKP